MPDAYLMSSAIEIDRINASSLNIGIEDQSTLVIIRQSNDISDKLFRFYTGEWGI